MDANDNRAPSPRRQRRHPRHDLDERLVVTCDQGGKPKNLHGRCTSLSLGGFGAVLAGHLESGEVVSVEFRFGPSSLPMRLRAHVRHRRGFHHGFEFLGLSTAQTRSLRDLISEVIRSPEE
ncbi:MAG TPA: PilZ domain-containing protein [Terriglobales bacterium]|nr:PilZ domain-containing protein [Terriglobales bacterium]